MTSRLRAVGALAAAFAVGVVGLGAGLAGGRRTRGATRCSLAPAGRSALQHEIDAVLRARPGGTQISQYQVSWQGGEVVLSLPRPRHRAVCRARPAGSRAGALSSAVATSDSCPWSFSARYTCFYSDVGFSGRRLQFADTYCSSAVNFGDWGFSNTISSWVNNSSHTVSVYDGPNTTGALLWRQYGVGNSANVGSAANDRADSASIC